MSAAKKSGLGIGEIMFSWLRELFTVRRVKPQPREQFRYRPTESKMDEGDYHSGPYGYSPNTAYPETQYGSRFDEEAEWNSEN